MEANQSFILSIRCITYNHSAFITNALNGFVMQQTSFPFFAVIIDDASTEKNGKRRMPIGLLHVIKKMGIVGF